MSSINSDEIISILKEEIENFDTMSKDSEVGTVVTVGDGIATIYGIDHAMYGLPLCLHGFLCHFQEGYIRSHSYEYPVPFP